VNVLTLFALIWVLGSLSLVAIGGGNTVLPELHAQSVWNYKWLTDGEFADIFAIAQAAPGPSTALMAALIGMKAAGWPGALVAALAMLLPAAALTCVASFAWERFRAAPWRVAVEKGLAPIAMGFLLATTVIIVRAADHSWPAFIVTGIATVVLAATRINPLIVMAVAGFLGWLGLVY
jgi:chromate transporter